MASISTPIRPALSFFPSTVNELFSVQYDGKTHELSSWQKVAVVVTGIAGIALLGIGVLFGFSLSFYLRYKLVEQLSAQSTVLPTPPALITPLVVQPVLPNPALIVPLPQLSPAPQLPTVDPEPPATIPTVQPTPVPVDQPVQPNPVRVDQPAQVNAEAEADRLMAGRVKTASAKIDALRVHSKNKPTIINGKTLNQLSGNGRYFVYIEDSHRTFYMNGFDPLSLPPGVYCLYAASTPRLKEKHSQQFNQVMIDEFGAENIYHMIVLPQTTEMGVDKIHPHQLTLYSGLSSTDSGNPPANLANIKKFSEAVAYRYLPK